MDCFQSYDESTGIREHLGPDTQDLARKGQELKNSGYLISHRNGVFTYTLYKDHLHPLPLEWQMSLDEIRNAYGSQKFTRREEEEHAPTAGALHT